MKFGGTSVADAERMIGVSAIVRGRLDRRPVVVVSALAGVTDLLERVVEAARRDDRDALERGLAELERRHRWVVAGAIEDGSARHDLSLAVDAQFEELRQLLRSIRILGELTARARDALLSFGEALSTRILTAVLIAHGLAAREVDARQVLTTDEHHGGATPKLKPTAERAGRVIEPLVRAGQVPVLGGFVGATRDGVTTTLGRGGSDTSAAILGAVLGAEEIEIWTDVPGLMSADPKVVPGARTLAEVSFAEAAELAFYGARVLHPSAVWPAVRRRIPVRVLSSIEPDRPGTVIREHPAPGAAPLAAVASRRGVRPLRVANRTLRADPDFVPRVLAGARRAGAPAELMVASEMALTLVVRGDADEQRLRVELGEAVQVQRGEPGAIVCAVGAGLGGDAAVRGRVLTALAALDPWLVGLGGSACSVAALLPEPRLAESVRALHRDFFEQTGPR